MQQIHSSCLLLRLATAPDHPGRAVHRRKYTANCRTRISDIYLVSINKLTQFIYFGLFFRMCETFQRQFPLCFSAACAAWPWQSTQLLLLSYFLLLFAHSLEHKPQTRIEKHGIVRSKSKSNNNITTKNCKHTYIHTWHFDINKAQETKLTI